MSKTKKPLLPRCNGGIFVTNMEIIMAKFKCKASGLVYEFTQPVDIETTAQNPAYEAVEDAPAAVEVKTKKVSKDATKEG